MIPARWAADGHYNALAGGGLAAAVVLVVLAWVLLKTSARMPIGKFFSATSILIGVLAVVLIGKGAAALQEAGWLTATPVAGPRLEWLGTYPTAGSGSLARRMATIQSYSWRALGAVTPSSAMRRSMSR